MTAKAAEDQDQSMEEILQSIKRIIADEEEPAAASSSGSDVLELTDMVEESGTADAAAIDAMFDGPRDVATMPPSEMKPSALDNLKALVSDDVATTSSAALRSLAEKAKPAAKPAPRIDSPAFRSGTTLEDLMIEALQPMLKSWLDANLPQIVQHLVEKEIRRISNS